MAAAVPPQMCRRVQTRTLFQVIECSVSGPVSMWRSPSARSKTRPHETAQENSAFPLILDRPVACRTCPRSFYYAVLLCGRPPRSLPFYHHSRKQSRCIARGSCNSLGLLLQYDRVDWIRGSLSMSDPPSPCRFERSSTPELSRQDDQGIRLVTLLRVLQNGDRVAGPDDPRLNDTGSDAAAAR